MIAEARVIEDDPPPLVLSQFKWETWQNPGLPRMPTDIGSDAAAPRRELTGLAGTPTSADQRATSRTSAWLTGTLGGGGSCCSGGGAAERGAPHMAGWGFAAEVVPPGGGAGRGGSEWGADGGKPEGKGSSSNTPEPPRGIPYPLQWLDEKNSLGIKEPVRRKDRKGDIRFVCDDTNCSIESDTSFITMLYSKPGATQESCRIALSGADSRRLPLAAVAAGSEICVKHPSGDIALLVVQVKSTALPKSGISFLTADMTVWRA